jgi:GDP-mannose 6-dehydrogenase
VCSNPEFLREGSSIKDFDDPPFTLIGAMDPAAAEPVKRLYAGIGAQLFVTDIQVAEAVKYVCNCFHGLKIGFANEIGNVCKAMDIDSHEVMRIVCEDTKLNISPAYLKPGFAFGGSCLPKDLRALTYRAKTVDVPTPLLSSILESNRLQVERGVAMVLATGARRIGILGMAFKAGTDDLRESPVVALVERLIGKGLEISVFDRYVSEAGVMGANRAFVQKEIPHIWSLLKDSVQEVLEGSDVLVVGNDSREFGEVEDRIPSGTIVIDLARAFGPRVSDESYRGICW